MRKRPIQLIVCSLLFLYFPFELLVHGLRGFSVYWDDFLFSVILPGLLLFGLLRVTKVGWYTLIAFGALWGIKDLHQYYILRGSSIWPVLFHILVYSISLGYFITPRVRHLYFDPKMRWWRTKPRFETHLPMMTESGGKWDYPVIKNISEGGCFIETPHLYGMKQHFQMYLPLPIPLTVSVFKAQVEVRWVSDKGPHPGMGVEFLNLSKENLISVKQLVRQQL